MNILFIYSLYDAGSSQKPLNSLETIQFGISYISAYLKAHGHETKLDVIPSSFGNKYESSLGALIRSFQPRLVCFTAVSTEYAFICEVARYIKRNFPDTYLLIGGPHVSLNPEGVLADFDALCVGEGEFPTLELVKQLEKKDSVPSCIPNLWIRNGSEIERNNTRSFLQDLDILPFPDRAMWERWVAQVRSSRVSVLLGRGCPFDCSYCCNHALRKLSTGNYTRFRSVENILREVSRVILEYPLTKEVYFEVESIGTDMHWVRSLSAGLESLNRAQTEPVSFGTNIRVTPNLDFSSVFRVLKKANFRFINIGLESGSEKIRQEVMRRNYSNEEVIRAVQAARSCGLQVSFLNMMGLPGESYIDFQETIRINRICQPDWVGVSIFYPYPGTDLYRLCSDRNLLREPISTKMERSLAVLDLPGFGKNKIQKCRAWFEFDIYRGKRPLHRLLLAVLYNKLKSNPGTMLLLRRIKQMLKPYKYA